VLAEIEKHPWIKDGLRRFFTARAYAAFEPLKDRVGKIPSSADERRANAVAGLRQKAVAAQDEYGRIVGLEVERWNTREEAITKVAAFEGVSTDAVVQSHKRFTRRNNRILAPSQPADERSVWSEYLQIAVASLLAERPSLLCRPNVWEESVTSRLAHHLTQAINGREHGLFVDVELHRYGSSLKPSPVGRHARVDLVVHDRDPSNHRNILAVEVKWDDALQQDSDAARKKLCSYLANPLCYRMAALIVLPRRPRLNIKLEWCPGSGESTPGLWDSTDLGVLNCDE
jgi:hypothetical protein